MIPNSTIITFTKWPEGPGLDPHEIELVLGWHCVGEPGSWDLEGLFTDLNDKLVHSHWRGARPTEDGISRQCRQLVFEKQKDVYVAVSEQTPDCGILRVWARDPEQANS